MKDRKSHRRRILFESLEHRNLLAVGLPYSQNFDILPTEDWTYESTNDGRIEVVAGRLREDDSVDGDTYSLNKANLHANLVGQTGVRLVFSHWDLEDEEHAQDGIHLSANGTDWEKVWDAKQGTFDLDLDKLAADAGLSYADDFQIGFWQYDNWSADKPYDGREWDDITLHAPPPPPPPTIQTLPYTQDFAAKPGPENGWEYSSTGDGRIEVIAGRLRMDDSTSGGYSLNEATLHVDLQGETNVHFTGQHWDLEDEEHDQDGIFVSADGAVWEKFDVTQGSFDIKLPAGTTMIKLSQYDNYPADVPYDGREWDNLKIEAVLPPVTQVVTLGSPYVQDFATKPGFAEGWEYASSHDGRIGVVAGRLRMDDSTRGGYSLNEAILHVDIQGETNVHLTGQHWDLEDEEHAQDGIFVSDGTTWEKFDVTQGSFDIKLPAGTTMIKLSQYDNYPANSDGREWDNLKIEVVPPPTPQVIALDSPYVQNFVTKPGPAEGWEYVSTNQGRIEVVSGALRMDDSVNGGNYSLNEAILHVSLQLAATQEALLTGRIKDINDEEHSQDGVFISSDGTTWTRVIGASGVFEVLLPADTAFIKLSQYDNYSYDLDGREFDDVGVEVRDYSQPIDWPVDLGFYKDVFVYGGTGATSRTLYAADSLGLTKQDLLTSSSSTSRSVINGGSSDLNGALLFPDGQPRFRHVFQNGGNATDQAVALGDTGKLVYQTYVTNGGTYSGSCAGMFVAGDGYWRYWELVPKSFSLSGYSSTTHSVSFDADDGRFYEILVEQGVTDGIINSIGHYGGPYVKDLDSDDPRIEKLGRVYNVGGKLYNTPYLVAFKANETSGRVVPQPSHPEISRSGDKLRLMEAIVLYAMEGGRKIPDLKGTLAIGDTVTMDASDTKIGDGQYHRYTIDVQSGTDKLDLSLYGLSSNADVYVQYESPANAESYLYKGTQEGRAVESIRIDSPQAGTWHVSVHGAHEVKNGGTYTLAAAEAPPAPDPGCDIVGLNGQVQTVFDQYGFTGTVIATACNQQVFLDSKGGKSDTSQYVLASVSKHFTAAAIMKLEEMGQLSVNDKYSDHVPGGSSVTLHKLLTHTRYGSFSYSNDGYWMLYNVVNRITGNAREFLQTEFLDKAGMTNSSSSGWAGAGGIVSTAEDMAKWDRAFNTGVVLTQASVDKMKTPHVASNNYGYGLYNPPGYSYHSGSYDNWISRYRMYENSPGTTDDDTMWLILTRGGVSYSFVTAMNDIFKPA